MVLHLTAEKYVLMHIAGMYYLITQMWFLEQQTFEFSESAILTVEYSLSILSLRQLQDILQTQLENKNSEHLKVSTS